MKVDHLSFLVRDLDEGIQRFTLVFGEVKHIERVEEQKVDVGIFELENVKLELIAPHADNDRLLDRLDQKGEGFHHFAIRGEGIDEKLVKVKEFGIKLTDEKSGANNSTVQFIHPKQMNGNLIEIVK